MPPPEIVPLPNGQFAQNCYLILLPEGPEAILVDPGEEPDLFLAEAGRRGRTIGAIWLTHAHIDHILGVGAIKAATAAPVFLHPADRLLYDSLPLQAARFGFAAASPPAPDRTLEHGQQLVMGGTAFEVRHVPGHSPGHVAFVGEGAVLSGDVLFEGSIGRTDLPGGDYPTLMASIEQELLVLPDATIVYPGHGPPTTIGRERRTNPFLAPGSRGRG